MTHCLGAYKMNKYDDIYVYMDSICSSNGHFQEYPLNASLKRPTEKQLRQFLDNKTFNKLDMVTEIEKTQKLEGYLRSHYHICDLTTVDGMTCYFSSILDLLPNEYKVIQRLNDCMLEALYSARFPQKAFEYYHIDKPTADCLDLREIMCLTRVTEDQQWVNSAYKFYSSLQLRNFMEDYLTFFIFERKDPVLERLEQKNTVWEDKIGGSIFAYPCKPTMKNPYLRTALRFIHYLIELNLHSKVVKGLVRKEKFGEWFSGYLSENAFVKDFFGAHALFESYIWDQAVKLLQEALVPRKILEFDNIALSWSDNGKQILSSNSMVDIVSNFAQERKESAWLYRTTAMQIKKELLCFLMGRELQEKDILKIVIDGGII